MLTAKVASTWINSHIVVNIGLLNCNTSQIFQLSLFQVPKSAQRDQGQRKSTLFSLTSGNNGWPVQALTLYVSSDLKERKGSHLHTVVGCSPCQYPRTETFSRICKIGTCSRRSCSFNRDLLVILLHGVLRQPLWVNVRQIRDLPKHSYQCKPTFTGKKNGTNLHHHEGTIEVLYATKNEQRTQNAC